METVIKAKKQAKAAPVVVLMDDAGKKHIASMFDAISTEALAITNAKLTQENSTAATWNTLRAETLEVLKDDKSVGKAYTLALLQTFAAECTAAGIGRGKQYASDLKRAARLAAANVELPAELLTCSRREWTDNEVWAANAILKPSGNKETEAAKKAQREALAKKAESLGGTVGEAVVIVLEDFRTLQAELASIPVGTFRDEAVRECLAAINRVKAKVRQATGSGNH